MDEKIKRVTMALAAMDGMTPEHFHAQDESFRIGYYSRARAAIEAYAAALAGAGYVMVPRQPEDDRVERGVSALLDFDRRFENEDAAVRRIYEVMNGISC